MVKIEQIGGAACHTGHRTCFHYLSTDDGFVETGEKVFDPREVYGKMSQVLNLGIPKGSLEKATVELFAKSGWKININSRNYFPEIDDPEIHCSVCRAQEMSRYVEQGVLDAGLTGLDWTLENNSKVKVVDDLVYSKVSARPARWVLAVPSNSDIKSIEDLEGRKIATELVNFTRRYFKERGVNVQVEFSWGATEAKVVSGLADAIVEVTETGTTIKAHGLQIIHELMLTNTQLIANRNSWKDDWKKVQDQADQSSADGRPASRGHGRAQTETYPKKT